jgi:HEPN domain-containing protein
MHLDPIIIRRFKELNIKAEAVLAAKIVDFVSLEGNSYYKVPSEMYKEWATNVLNLLHRTFGESSIHYKNLAEHYSKFEGWVSDFNDSYGIFRAAREDYEGGYLFNIRTLAKAEILSDAIDQAKALLASGYKDPACILARVALESVLKDLASRHGVSESKLDRMNADLTRIGAYNMAKQKQITAWAEIGNKAAHGNWSDYTEQDAAAMVTGVEALIADL